MSAFMHTDGEAIRADLLALSDFGRAESGECTRLSWSEPYYQAARWMRGRFEEAGLTAVIDGVGNVFGCLPGETEDTILCGSHLDTVVNAGIFDGAAGVVTALEAARTLRRSGARLQHTLMIAGFVEEEGLVLRGLFGSRSFAGLVPANHPDVAGIEKHGLSYASVLDSASRRPQKLCCYLELHPEQGGVLDHSGETIGVVDAIVGYERYEVTVLGQSNHAGTTPMPMRDDALVKAARLMLDMREAAGRIDPEMVCTFGGIHAVPGVYNTIPRQAELLLDVRSVRAQSIRAFTRELESYLPADQLQIRQTLQEPPVPMSAQVGEAIFHAARELGLAARHMPSGAAHDATAMAAVTQCGMIFVPSVGGVSHSPKEKTEWSDLQKGADVLVNAIAKLDQTLA